MPRTKKAPATTTTTSSSSKFKELGKLLAATAAFADDDDDESAHGEAAYYTGGFGTRRGTVCHCARCLRRSGPLTDDPGQLVDDIIGFLEETDPDGSVTGFQVDSKGDINEHRRLLAETTGLALERGDAEVLRTILDNIMDLPIQQELATRLAVPAAQHGHAHIIYLLDKYEADFEEPDPARGGPPLMHAANNGHISAVNALLECGAYPESSDYNSQTALMVAIFSDRASAAEALLAGGALVDAVDEKGRTALCHAARYGSLDCISVLAQYQADVFHADKDGRTPLEIAEDCSRIEAAAQIKRLQQRQKLRERKETRQKEAGSSSRVMFDRKELMQKEAEALKHALALVKEEESEAQRREARRQQQKAKKNKRKGKAMASAPQGDPTPSGVPVEQSVAESAGEAAESSPAPMVSSTLPANGSAAEGHREASDPDRKKGAKRGEAAKYGRSRRQTEDASEAVHEREAKQANDSEAEDLEDPAENPLADLRQAWDVLLREAASCKDATLQASLVLRVKKMAEECAAAGISVKYGKKVLGKLEKASSVREALLRAHRAKQPDRAALQAALEQARSLRSVLDEKLLAKAENKLQQLQLRHEEDSRRRDVEAATREQGQLTHRQTAARPSMTNLQQVLDRLKAQEGVSKDRGTHTDPAYPQPPRLLPRGQSLSQQPLSPAPAPQPKIMQQKLGRPARDQPKANGVRPQPEFYSPTPVKGVLVTPCYSETAERDGNRGAAKLEERAGFDLNPSGASAGLHRPIARTGPPSIGSQQTAAISEWLEKRASLSQGQPEQVDGLSNGQSMVAAAAADGRATLSPQPRVPKAHLQESVGPPGFPPSSTGRTAEIGSLFQPTASTPLMHDQGLANIWQQRSSIPGSDGMATTATTSAFFTGSLFEVPLPSQSSLAHQGRHLEHNRRPRPAFVMEGGRQLGPIGSNRAGGSPPPHNWLGELLGGAPPSRPPAEQQTHRQLTTAPPHGFPPTHNLGSIGLNIQHATRMNGRHLDLEQQSPGFGRHLSSGWTDVTGGVAQYTAKAARASRLSAEMKRSPQPRWETPSQAMISSEGEECVVCFAAPQDSICIPCGHQAMCSGCSSAVCQQSGLCPICRCPIEYIHAA